MIYCNNNNNNNNNNINNINNNNNNNNSNDNNNRGDSDRGQEGKGERGKRGEEILAGARSDRRMDQPRVVQEVLADLKICCKDVPVCDRRCNRSVY